MQKIEIIGLAGSAQVGKDTIAAFMQPEGWHRVAFADDLKCDLSPLLRKVGCDLRNPENKQRARPLLVAYGATMRQFVKDYWVTRLEKRILGLNHFQGVTKFVVSDVRYHNEVKWVESWGGKVYRVMRPGFEPVNQEERLNFHLIDIHSKLTWIVNNGDLAQLKDKVTQLCERWNNDADKN